MGHRLSKIYTRTGDDGTTGLGDGSRTEKDAARIEAIGSVDELNTVIGLALTETLPAVISEVLHDVQHRLFDLGGELSIPGHQLLGPQHVQDLESALDALNEDLEPLKEFVLPGGSAGAAWCHHARGVCRRAERRLVTLARDEAISKYGQQFLNRLSDYLFVAARYANHGAGIRDVMWQREST